ncbi:hypothetical protein [Cystobacter fuscus]|uniref:hypothetical protein n=1 Tax=Cystobacter fuscus TaxID=43 RepID=UPI002B2EA533|nr:hypothetical protein F0U63_19485 [Cystobacter fuscus]
MPLAMHSSVLASPYREFLRATKITWGFVTAGAICFSLLLFHGFMNEDVPVLCAGLSTAVAIYLGCLYVASLLAKPEKIQVAFDRRLPVSARRTPEGGRMLTLYGEELDRLAVASGFSPLSQFMAPLPVPRQGAACHEPASAIPLVEALIRALEESPQTLPESALLLVDLRYLLERLREARSAQARFCLIPSDTWSGLVETNLGLHL